MAIPTSSLAPRPASAADALIVIEVRQRPVSAKANGTDAGNEFREHCIERQGLGPDDTERVCWFDLEALSMTLLADE
jgi:hypothetical protein